MSNIKTNLKSITKDSISLPVEAAAVTLGLTADVANVALSTVKGVVPVTKQLGNIIGMFIAGMANSDVTEEQAKTIYNNTTVATVMTAIEAASLKAGQDMMKAWDEEEAAAEAEFPKLEKDAS